MWSFVERKQLKKQFRGFFSFFFIFIFPVNVYDECSLALGEEPVVVVVWAVQFCRKGTWTRLESAACMLSRCLLVHESDSIFKKLSTSRKYSKFSYVLCRSSLLAAFWDCLRKKHYKKIDHRDTIPHLSCPCSKQQNYTHVICAAAMKWKRRRTNCPSLLDIRSVIWLLSALSFSLGVLYISFSI